MTGNSETPRALSHALYSNPYLLGPLSRMLLARADASAPNAMIKAIWRNEQGPVEAPSGRAAT